MAKDRQSHRTRGHRGRNDPAREDIIDCRLFLIIGLFGRCLVAKPGIVYFSHPPLPLSAHTVGHVATVAMHVHCTRKRALPFPEVRPRRVAFAFVTRQTLQEPSRSGVSAEALPSTHTLLSRLPTLSSMTRAMAAIGALPHPGCSHPHSIHRASRRCCVFLVFALSQYRAFGFPSFPCTPLCIFR